MPHHQPVLTSTEEALVDTLRVSLNSGPGGLRQFGRRLARNPPRGCEHPVELQAAITAVLASAPADPQGGLRRRSTGERFSPPVSLPADDGVGVGAAVQSDPPVLDELTEHLVSSVIDEHRKAERLTKFNLSPSRKILLTGAPGVGKTMTARYIAQSLGVPLVTVDLGTMMSSFLGRSAQNLQEILQSSRDRSSALFIDEFDAIAKRRDDGQDVGELKRLVNVLLLELDSPSTGLLIAATNHPELLDRAVARRFDRIIVMPAPDVVVRRRLVARHATMQRCGLSDADQNTVALAMTGMSHSEVCSQLDRLARDAVLADGSWPEISEHVLRWAVKELHGSEDATVRAAIAKTAVNTLGMSQRKTAQLLGVTHPTIAKLLSQE